MIDRPADRGPGQAASRAWVERIAAERGIDAVIEIVGDTAPVAVDVWVIEKSPRRLGVSRVAVEPNATNPSERLAIHAIEVLRSSFLEHAMAARERHGEPIADRTTTTLPRARPAKPANLDERFGLELGAVALTSLDGVGPALSPLVRLDWAARSWFVLQAALAGLGSRPTVATAAGHARVAQQYGTLGGCYRMGAHPWLRPFFAVSAGALHTSVEGQADSPRQGHAVDRWSFLLDASWGAGLRLYGPYQLTLAAHVQVAEPYVAIHFSDPVVATTGRPNLAMTLALGAWL
ncbi:MAG: hypothetical protein JW940_18000 [Polyangiaceae bacterium]|nr:hypothetical protein [Polyangiaceae bacterium]